LEPFWANGQIFAEGLTDQQGTKSSRGCCVGIGKEQRRGRYYVFKNPKGKAPRFRPTEIDCGGITYSVNASTILFTMPGEGIPEGEKLARYSRLPRYLKGLPFKESRSWSLDLDFSCCSIRQLSSKLKVNAAGDRAERSILARRAWGIPVC
jgi:hypothetical protein